LGTLPGLIQSAAYGINDQGVIVGSFTDSRSLMRPFVATTTTGLVELSTLSGAKGHAAAISNDNVVAGYYTDVEEKRHTMVWRVSVGSQ
jgi:uncharacterized membrane protein